MEGGLKESFSMNSHLNNYVALANNEEFNLKMVFFQHRSTFIARMGMSGTSCFSKNGFSCGGGKRETQATLKHFWSNFLQKARKQIKFNSRVCLFMSHHSRGCNSFTLVVLEMQYMGKIFSFMHRSSNSPCQKKLPNKQKPVSCYHYNIWYYYSCFFQVKPFSIFQLLIHSFLLAIYSIISRSYDRKLE